MEDCAFICYARRDADFVLDLAARLKDRGCPIWLDQWNIEPGQDWDQTIDAALTGCATFLIVLSPDAVRSPEVRGELRSALNARKRIVPVLFRPCEIPRQLQTTQYLDVSDAPDMTDALVDDLIGALRGESRPRGDRWRDVQQTLSLLSWLSRRLKAVGASAGGGIVLLALAGLLAEASYSRLLGIQLPRSAPAALNSGLQFVITLLTQALIIMVPAGLLLLLVFLLGRAGRQLVPAMAADRLRRALGRPGLLWAAQIATCAFVLFVLLPRFARLLPLDDVAFNRGLSEDVITKLSEGGRHYRAMVVNVASATLVVSGLEAWRRRLHRKRQHQERAEALISLGLALPLYLLVAAELLLLPIGHGLLWLPSRREHSASIVTFTNGVRYAELKGKSLRLVDFRSTAADTFYCPQGPRTWVVREEDIASFTGTTTGPLAVLLKDFDGLSQCVLPGSVP